MKIEQLKTDDCLYAPFLSPIPLERDLAGLLKNQPDHKDLKAEYEAAWKGWVDRAKQHGIDQPVLFYEDGGKIYICEGRNRHASAEEAGLETLPGLRRTKEEAKALALAAQTQRKASSKGAAAYLALTLNPHLVEDAKPGPKSKKGNCGIEYYNSIPALAAATGIKEETLNDAKKTWYFFRENPEIKKRLEGKVLAGIISPGAARKVAPTSLQPEGKALPSFRTVRANGNGFWHTLGNIHNWDEGEWSELEDEVMTRLTGLDEKATVKAAEIFHRATARLLAGEGPMLPPESES